MHKTHILWKLIHENKYVKKNQKKPVNSAFLELIYNSFSIVTCLSFH